MILMKLGDEYKLYSHDSCIATTHESPYKKLSLKNCQAIANGYDLNELAMGYDLYENINFVGQMRAFKAGFQKALEILGDKKFSLEDMKKVYLNSSKYEWFGDCIKSLQQTEWDVEVEMENSLTNGYKNQPDNVIGFIAEYKSIPKLDKDGCLILKRK